MTAALGWCLLSLTALGAHAQSGPPATEGESPPAAAPPAAARLGPFEVRSAAGDALRVGFIGQLRLDLRNAPGDGDDRETELDVRMRRVRLRLDARLLNERLSLSVQLSTVPGSLELLDMFADYRFADHLSLRVGQFKTPFTRYRSMSFTALAMVDWAIAAEHFGAERQIGAMLHNVRDDGRGFSYAVGVFTGENARASFATGVGRTFGESLPNRSDLRTSLGPTELHPELSVRLGHGAEGVDAAINSDGRRGGLRHHVALSAAYDLAPTRARDFVARLSPELLLKWRGLMLNLVAFAGFFEPAGGGVDPASVGAIAELAYRFTERWELAGRYSEVRVLASMRRSARRRAAELIATAGEDRDEREAQYGAAGRTVAQEELGVGLTHYAVGTFLKAQLNATLLRTHAAQLRNGFVSQLQLQLEI